MMKGFKRFSWLLVLMLQVFLGVGAGFIALSFMRVETVAESTTLGTVPVGGMNMDDARKSLETYLQEKIKNGVLTLEVDQSTHRIPYTELDVSVDMDKTLENLQAVQASNSLDELLNGMGKDINLTPVIKLNSGKLLAQCEAIFKPLEREPVAEYYKIEGDVLRYIPQVPGLTVDYQRLEEELKQVIATLGDAPYRVNTQEPGTVFVSTPGPKRYDELFSVLISKSNMPIDSSLEGRANEALQALYGRVIKKGEEMNLAQLIDFNTFSSDVEKDLLNRMATALYQSGLSIEGIEVVNRKQANHPVPYSEPGLEAIIEGVGANLVLKNNTERSLMLLTQVSQGELSVYWVSTGELRSGILIAQKRDEVPPSVITTVNKDLAKGETRVISEGSPGYTVYVSRIIDDERVELYVDKYHPISKMVETGDGAVRSSSK